MAGKRKRAVADSASPKVHRPMAKRGKDLTVEYLTRPKHNPGRKKQRREYFHNAQLRRKYRKMQRREGVPDDATAEEATAEEGGSPKEELSAEPTASEKREKRRPKPLPFQKEYVKAQKEREERQSRRDEAERRRQEALKARRRKRDVATKRTKKGQPIMRHQVQAILDKIENEGQ
ncbi:hypothetical protein CTAYLR_007581 [Chrysophaeum taylorii]|uniref:rRNA-processing protein FYV7 n=1 Tax=Chrysophaeum taylorii TaxID=2483200 RepID=A0AAD7UF07_9STRA|nr:hypothetical protein CTAYLR_007581 [Chrysophaeum taylorii]